VNDGKGFFSPRRDQSEQQEQNADRTDMNQVMESGYCTQPHYEDGKLHRGKREN